MQGIYALYTRVSTDEQAKTGMSLESQKDKLLAFAKYKGWQEDVIDIFCDDGESAKNMYRPNMQKMIKKIEQGQVAAVVTTAIDRLSRNLLDMLQFVEMCQKHNTAYICTSLDFDTSTPIGKMVLQILGAFAEFERSMIQTRVKETMLKAAHEKQYMAAAPFGYQLVEGRLEIIPTEAEWVQKAADMFVAGYGYRAVAKYLNDAGVQTKKGVDWTSSTVRGMLTNELYVGTVIYNRRFYNSAGKMCWKDKSEWIENKNVHEPILSSTQWEEINKRITRKMPKGGQRQYKYKLSGLLKCGHCEASMGSRRYGNKGIHKDKFIFVCSNYQKNGSCGFNYVFIDEAEQEVLSILENITNGLIDIPAASLHNAEEAKREEFAKQEKAIKAKFDRQIEAFENGIITLDELKEAKERVEKEKAVLTEQKNRAETVQHHDVIKQLKAEAKEIVWMWKHGDLEIIRNSLVNIFESVTVADRKIADYLLNKDLFEI